MSPQHVQADSSKDCQTVGKYLTTFQRKLLHTNLQPELTAKQRQRIQIMLLADEGKTQAQICQELGCCQATARHWITMARNNLAHHWKSNPIGRPTVVDEEYIQRLKQLVTKNPQEVNIPHKDYQYPFKRWTAQKLSQHLYAELGVKVTPQHLNRLLKQMGLSTRPKLNSAMKGDKPKDKEQDRLRSSKCIQISDLDSVSIIEASEIWKFNPLLSN